MKAIFLALLLTITLQSQDLTVVCVGDSHTTVEAGMTKELSARYGQPVTYVPIGVEGRRTYDFYTSLSTKKGQYWSRLDRIQNPTILLLAFGSNDGMGPRLSPSYKGVWKHVITELKAKYPTTKIIMVGPPTCSKNRIPLLPQIVTAQKEVAATMGLQFIDRSTMVVKGLKPDGVHYSFKGYAELGKLVVRKMEM